MRDATVRGGSILQDLFGVFCAKFPAPDGYRWSYTQRCTMGEFLYSLVLVSDVTGESRPALYSHNEYHMAEMKVALEVLCDSVSNDQMRPIMQAAIDACVVSAKSEE